MPKDAFEESFMISESTIDRLQVEYNELRERCFRLDKAMSKPHEEIIQAIGALQFSYLLAQRMIMRNYLDIIAYRILDLKKRNKK